MAFLQHCKFVHENVHGRFNLNQIKFACVLFENEAYLVSFDDKVYHILNNRYYEIKKLWKKGVIEFRYGYNDGKPTNYHILALTFDGKIYGLEENEVVRINKSFFNIKLLWMTLYFSKGSFAYWILKWRKMPKIFLEYKSIDCGSNHEIALTKYNSLTIWGSNDFGQFGNGGNSTKEKDSSSEYTKELVIKVDKQMSPQLKKALLENKKDKQEMLVTKVDRYKSRPKLHFMCYLTFTLFILMLIIFSSLIPWALIPLIIITSIFCPWFYFKWFKPRNYKLIPKIEENCLITKIACGSVHNLVLCENGNVWGWGDNSRGQLGRIPTESAKQPRLIFQNALMISASMNQSLVLCEGGILYSMGSNILAQCGKYDFNKYSKPLVLKMNFVEIAAFNNIALAMDENGVYYAWGLFKYEELREKQVIDDKKKESEDEETDQEKRVTSFEQGENAIEVKEKEGIIRKVIRFYIIPEPKQANCSSFNNFVERYSSMTYNTIQNKSCNALNEPGTNFYHQAEVAVNLQLNKTLDECNFDEFIVDPKDIMVIEYYTGENEKKNDTTNNFHIGDANKFSIFDNSPIQGNVSVSDTTQTGKQQTTFDKVLNLFNK